MDACAAVVICKFIRGHPPRGRDPAQTPNARIVHGYDRTPCWEREVVVLME